VLKSGHELLFLKIPKNGESGNRERKKAGGEKGLTRNRSSTNLSELTLGQWPLQKKRSAAQIYNTFTISDAGCGLLIRETEAIPACRGALVWGEQVTKKRNHGSKELTRAKGKSLSKVPPGRDVISGKEEAKKGKKETSLEDGGVKGSAKVSLGAFKIRSQVKGKRGENKNVPRTQKKKRSQTLKRWNRLKIQKRALTKQNSG